MEEISVKGKTFVKAKVIARELGYTNDYVGQLCRGGKVAAELVGRTWYVDPDSIKGHKANRYRSSKASTSRELKSQVARASAGQAKLQPENFYFKQSKVSQEPIAYENDEASLMPTPNRQGRSHELPIELADAEKVAVDSQDGKDYHFTAPKRQKTKFFGTLEVTEFMTEVEVADAGKAAPQKVKVQDNVAEPERKPEQAKKTIKKAHKEEHPERVHQVKVHRLTHKNPPIAKAKKSFASRLHPTIPVTGDNEVVTLPLTYHLITAGSLVAALLIAATLVGMESTITATVEAVSTKFTFTIKNISALIFFVK